jgi:RNA polymerase primary sigma factor
VLQAVAQERAVLADLGHHATLSREEELQRTTRIASLHRTLKDLMDRRHQVASILQAALKDADGDLVHLCEDELLGIEARMSETEQEAKAARDEFLAHNYRLVFFFARKAHRVAGPAIDFEDLVMQGLCGMIEAITKFDPALGCKFSTFAAYYIRAKVGEFSYEQKGAIRVPIHRHRQVREISRFAIASANANGLTPTGSDTAKFMGLSLSKLGEILNAATMACPASIDAPLSREADAGSLGEILADVATSSPEDIAMSQATTEILDDAFDRLLNERERLILKMCFGLGDASRRSRLEEIGRLFGVTRQRVCQVEQNALRKLRRDPLVAELQA